MRKYFKTAALFLVAAAAVACSDTPRYKDASLPVEKRVDDLLSRMTLEEKVAQLSHLHAPQLYDGQTVDMDKLRENAKGLCYGCIEGFNLTSNSAREGFYAIQRYLVEECRLGIPALVVTESLHGSVHDGSTIFPQSIAVGATFNPALAHRMTKTIAGELVAQGANQTLSPCLDVVRDLRWGRVEECFGEDPYLCGVMGVAEVSGYIDGGIWPMLKHFGPGAAPLGGLNLASVECGERDLRNIHLRPFETVVRNTDVKAVMSSYNSWNGVPNTASHFLLTELLRGEWGFDGIVYSDWGAVRMLNNFQHAAADKAEAARQALTAGVDIEASSDCYPFIPEMVADGRLDIAVVDRAVGRVLRTKFEMGLFENPYPALGDDKAAVHSAEAVALAMEIAEESVVLLKNEGGLLPLDVAKCRSIAVVGPNADQVQFGDYTWSRDNRDGVTPLQGIRRIVGNRARVNYAQGCDLTSQNRSGFARALAAVRESDVALVFVGSASASLSRSYGGATCGEGFDLSSLDLTGVQEELVRKVIAIGKPVVVVLVTGRPFSIPYIKDNAAAILMQWYGGECAGDAVADVIFGRVNPSGHLPVSIPRSAGHLPCYYNHLPTDRGFYHQSGTPEKSGRDYVFSSPDVLWTFGHGLSYTEFEYGNLSLSTEHPMPTDTVEVRFTVRNIGRRGGKAVPQLYVRDLVSSVVTPVKQLRAFDKVYVGSGESVDVCLRLPVQELAVYDLGMKRRVENGGFELQIGNSSADIRLKAVVFTGERPADSVAADNGVRTVAKTPGARTTVSGTIRDVQSTPVAGAVVKAEVSGRTVTADIVGRYTIACCDNDVLVVSAEGYESAAVEVKGHKKIDVKLAYNQH